MDQRPTFLGLAITPLNRRRLDNFNANRRGYWSLWIFLFIFFVTLFAEFIANDKPLLVRYDGEFYMPVFVKYTETTFGGDFETEAEYTDPEVAELIEEKGWIVWPLIPYSFDTVVLGLPVPSPSPPAAARAYLRTACYAPRLAAARPEHTARRATAGRGAYFAFGITAPSRKRTQRDRADEVARVAPGA